MLPPRILLLAMGVLLLQADSGAIARSATSRQAASALSVGQNARAARISIEAAHRGDPDAQAYLGFMYATGRGVPLNLIRAAYWYRRAAEQGHAGAQYQLGLLYDAGRGVPKSVVQAYMWVTLATAAANGEIYDARARIRDAIATKMTRGELAEGRAEAVTWRPRPEPRRTSLKD